MKLMTVTPPSNNRIAQLIDANLDRAREGLRVLEDWCRFGLKREDFSISIKDWRHQLGACHQNIYRNARLTSLDPAMGVSHPLQKHRSTPDQIVIANSSRVQEALRVIEEFTRITDPNLSKIASNIRYKTYEIELKIIKTKEGNDRREILESSSICLITSNNESLKEVVLQALKAGIKIIQYREKSLIDSKRIDQAKKLASLCRQFNALFIVNDRIDISLAVNADGVHLGQQDMPTEIARKLLGPEKIIGRSTHCLEDIQKAEDEGCDYIGIGPIFSSETKKELKALGTDYLKQGLMAANLPAFAIGGINTSNINKIHQMNKIKIAVADAIMNSPNPTLAIKRLSEYLK